MKRLLQRIQNWFWSRPAIAATRWDKPAQDRKIGEL